MNETVYYVVEVLGITGLAFHILALEGHDYKTSILAEAINTRLEAEKYIGRKARIIKITESREELSLP